MNSIHSCLDPGSAEGRGRRQAAPGVPQKGKRPFPEDLELGSRVKCVVVVVVYSSIFLFSSSCLFSLLSLINSSYNFFIDFHFSLINVLIPWP